MYCNMWVSRKIKFLSSYKFFSCLLFLVVSFNQVMAADSDVTWKKANSFYTAKQYDSAAVYYEQLLKGEETNVNLHYNLANTYYRLNKIGPAILHYEKAVHLDPDNSNAKDNLVLAKARVQNPVPEIAPIFFVTWWEHFLHAFRPDVWAWISVIVFLAVLTLIYFARTKKESFAHSGRWLSLAIVACLLCGCMAYFTYDAAMYSRKAVVLEPSAGLLEMPRNSSKILTNLPEGTVLEIYMEEGAFINVKLPNGRVGWLPATAVAKV